MKESNNNISNIQDSYSSDIDEYSFTVSHGNSSANVILKLGMSPEEEPSKEDITKGLVKYISAFEQFLTWQSDN